MLLGICNNDAGTVAASRICELLNGAIYSPELATCTAGEVHSTIDMMIPYGGMQDGVESVETIRAAQICTHRPVRMTMMQNLVEIRLRKLKKPPDIPREGVIGPQLKVEGWALVLQIAEEGLRLAASGHRREAMHALDRA